MAGVPRRSARRLAALVLAAGVLVATVALAGGRRPLLAQTAPAAPVAPVTPAGQLAWGLHVTLAARWLDPAETEALATPFMVLYAIHDALVKPMPAGIYTPSLAERVSVSQDGLIHGFTIRRGAKFHNGDPVTAEDVKFSFERYRGAAARLLHERVRSVQVVAPNHVRFFLREPWPDFMLFYGTTASGAAWIVPKKYVETVGEEGFRKAPIGAGPYRVVRFTPGVELVLEAFEGYWRKTPSVKRLVMRSITDEATRAAALRKGEVDIAYLLTGPIADEIKRTAGLRLVAPLLDAVFWLDLPEQWDPKSPWHDRRVRLAASLAVDSHAVNQAETAGFSRPTGSIIPRNFGFALAVDPPPHDPRRARQLLAEAGYPNGFDAGNFYPFPPYTSMGEAIAGSLQAVGIRTRIRTMERAAFLTAWRERKLKGVILGITGAAGNAATRLEAYVTRTGMYSAGVVPEIEELFTRQAGEVDAAKREALLHQIQRIIHERVMHVPIYELAFIWGVGPRVAEPGAELIKAYPYSAPYEDLKLRTP
jgi:peptide/nickel transport system substrate-binding protein